MFWDINFWADILKNYISSVATGVTLLLFGTAGYVVNKRYSIVQKITQKISAKSENLSVGNVEGDINIFQEVNRTPVPEKESSDTSADAT